jgi:hypothetical protein
VPSDVDGMKSSIDDDEDHARSDVDVSIDPDQYLETILDVGSLKGCLNQKSCASRC